MSRLFAVARTLGEIVSHFGVDVPASVEVPTETVEGTYGLVVVQKDGLRMLKSIPWGFPRHTREMRAEGEPPGRIGLVADLTNPLWSGTVVDPKYRCLIPITHFANPEGPKGEKKRTWFSMRKEPLAAWAGFCRNTQEFGPVFAGMTTTAPEIVRPLNDRMPVLLRKAECDLWLHGGIEDVIAFQFREPIASEELEVLHTRDLWRSGMPPRLQPRRQTSLLL